MTKHPPLTRNSSPEYFNALDGIRGYLALTIAVYHTAWASGLGQNRFIDNATSAVDIFFVLSGFIMYRLYSEKLDSAESASRYMKKRFARIYPLHFMTLLLLTGFAVVRVVLHYVGIANYEAGEILPFGQGAAETMGSYIAHLTLTQSMGVVDQLAFNVPSWSISAEFFAYAVFAIMMVLFKPKNGRHIALICALIALSYYTLSQLKPDMNINQDFGFLRCLGGFFTGVVTAWLLKYVFPNFRAVPRGRVSPVATLLEIGATILMIGFIISARGQAQFFIAPFALIFVFTFALGQGALSKLFSTRVSLYLGEISYSIYMVHFFLAIMFKVFGDQILFRLMGPDWNAGLVAGNALVIIYVGVVIFVSHFTYHWIEVRGSKAIMATDLAKLRADFAAHYLRRFGRFTAMNK